MGLPHLWGELRPHLTQCGLGRDLPPYQVASWSIQPFGHNRHGPKIGGCAPFGGEELGPHLTQCGRGRILSLSKVSSWSNQQFGHNTPTSQTGRTDRQTSDDSIGRTDFTNGRPKNAKIINRWYYSAARWHSGEVMEGNITFLWFLWFLICHR